MYSRTVENERDAAKIIGLLVATRLHQAAETPKPLQEGIWRFCGLLLIRS